jgi:hypothetical protein
MSVVLVDTIPLYPLIQGTTFVGTPTPYNTFLPDPFNPSQLSTTPIQRISETIAPGYFNAEILSFQTSHPKYFGYTAVDKQLLWAYWFYLGSVIHTATVIEETVHIGTGQKTTTVLSSEVPPAGSTKVLQFAAGNLFNQQLIDATTLTSTIYFQECDRTAINNHNRPNYYSLLSGYDQDSRTIPGSITFNSPITGFIALGYWRENIEPIPGLRSVFWREVVGAGKVGKPITFDIEGCMLGTLKVFDNPEQIGSKPLIESAIQGATSGVGRYPYKYLFQSFLPELFTAWNSLYALINDNPYNAIIYSETKALHCIGANNDHWSNRPVPTADINYDPTHPMYVVDNGRSYNWHLSNQATNATTGIGDLLVDSIRVIETRQYAEDIFNKAYDMHRALGQSQYGNNELDNTKERVTTLAFMIEKIFNVLGYRMDANGKIDQEREKNFVRKIVDNPRYDGQAYTPNSWGHFGRLTPHLSNSNGGEAWDVIYDLPQMMEALAEHQNRSLGIQQGTEITVLNAVTGQPEYYPNQLALMLEIKSKLDNIQADSKESFNLISVIGHELRELFTGIGIPTMFKSLYTRYGTIPFIGHQQDKGSINTRIGTVVANIAILVGQTLQPPIDRRGIVERLLTKPKGK